MGGKQRGKSTAICPYYKRDQGGVIVCEGWIPGTSAQLNFTTTQDKVAYMRDFCETRCWRGCGIAEMTGEKYK